MRAFADPPAHAEVELNFDHHCAVLEAMTRAGCAPHDPGVIAFDAVRHRFQVEGDQPGSRNGWFVLHEDGIPAGAFGSWKTGCSKTWRSEEPDERTEAERRQQQRPFADAQARRREEDRARHAQARARAETLWERSHRWVEARHPYLLKKRVPAIGLRQIGNSLVAPVRDVDGVLHSLEFIQPNGEKRFLKDGALEGHCHVLGTLQGADTLLLCEGYATGASLHRASGRPVVVCFHAGNLLPVALRVRRRCLSASLVFAADEDRYTKDNPGRTQAEHAARAVHGSVILPDFEGLDLRARPTDFNDLAILGGLPRLKASLAGIAQAQRRGVLPAGGASSPVAAPDPSPLTCSPTNEPRSGSPEPAMAHAKASVKASVKRELETCEIENEDRAMEQVMAMAASGRRRASTAVIGEPRRNLYQEVTDRMVEMIENGTAPWQRPWDRPHRPHVPTRPVNAATGKPYQGINILLLQASLLTCDDPRWCGYRQAQAQGWQVKAGASGTSIYFFKRLEIGDASDPDGEPLRDADGFPLQPIRKTIPLLRPHTVFHASQIEGIPSLEALYGPTDALPDHVWDREEHLEALLRRSGARIAHEGGIAFYSPREDRIVLPPRERFREATAYYGVAFHELGHWTGHASRLNRPQSNLRDSPEYAREELRAELASAFLGAELGIQHDLEAHAAYLDVYLHLLRQDNREIFRAARDAQGIADLILDRHPTWQLQQGICTPRTDPLNISNPMPEATSAPGGVHVATVREPIAEALPDTAEALPDTAEALPAAGVSPAPLPEPSPRRATPYQWVAAALRDLETSLGTSLEISDEDGDLGRFSRWIDAAVPLAPAPCEVPVMTAPVVRPLSGPAVPSHGG